jgi:hypothetical protein
MTTILDLPNELLLFVAESLPLSNVQHLRLACKRFHHILKRINRRRVLLYDIDHLVHLEDALDSLGDKYTNALYVPIYLPRRLCLIGVLITAWLVHVRL